MTFKKREEEKVIGKHWDFKYTKGDINRAAGYLVRSGNWEKNTVKGLMNDPPALFEAVGWQKSVGAWKKKPFKCKKIGNRLSCKSKQRK